MPGQANDSKMILLLFFTYGEVCQWLVDITFLWRGDKKLVTPRSKGHWPSTVS